MEPVAQELCRVVAVKAMFAIKAQSLAEQTLHVQEKTVALDQVRPEAVPLLFATKAE
jgi:hypothetical protein